MFDICEMSGLDMVRDAEECRVLKPGGIIVEATAGNTGIGIAILAGSSSGAVLSEAISFQSGLTAKT